MPTLQDIKKEQGLTNADIARSLGCCVSKASMMLQGRYIHSISDEEIAQLARALSNYRVVTFERCWLAMQESYNAWSGKPLDTQHERPAELRYRVSIDMGHPEAWDTPRSTYVEGVLVVGEARRIEQ